VDDLTATTAPGNGVECHRQALAGNRRGQPAPLSHYTLAMPTGIARATTVRLMLSRSHPWRAIWPFGYLVQRIYPLIGDGTKWDRHDTHVCPCVRARGARAMAAVASGEVLRVRLHGENENIMQWPMRKPPRYAKPNTISLLL